MDFQLSSDQEALRDGVRSFCEGRLPVEKLPDFEFDKAFDRELWGELAELGVFSLRLSEDEGGVGLGTADAVLVFAELGRRLVPGPTLWTHLAAGLVDGAATGEVVVGGLDLCSAPEEPWVVDYCDSLDVLIALYPDRVEKLDSKSLDAVALASPLDPLTPIHALRSLPAGERIGGAEDAQRLRVEGAALAAAQMLGIAESTQEMAVEYAKGREQFNRAIGSFQAIKHMAADMFVRQEVARAAVYAAGATIDDPVVGDVARAVSAAKVTAGDAAMKNARTNIQIHGGMGFTWEVPAHYYLKRTWVLENLFGTVDAHADALAAQVEANL